MSKTLSLKMIFAQGLNERYCRCSILGLSIYFFKYDRERLLILFSHVFFHIKLSPIGDQDTANILGDKRN